MWGDAGPGDGEKLMIRNRRCRGIRAHQKRQRPREEGEQERERQEPAYVGFPLQTHEMIPFPSSLCAARCERTGGLCFMKSLRPDALNGTSSDHTRRQQNCSPLFKSSQWCECWKRAILGGTAVQADRHRAAGVSCPADGLT